MARALPTIARGAKRERSEPAECALRCPRLSPEWKFRAFVALLKPQFKSAIAHRGARQRWPRSGRRIVEGLLGGVRSFKAQPRMRFATRDELLHITFDRAHASRAAALARRISQALPALWFTFNNRLLQGGRFYRQQGRYRLVPVSMRVPRLPRELYLTMVGAADHAASHPHHPRKAQNIAAK